MTQRERKPRPRKTTQKPKGEQVSYNLGDQSWNFVRQLARKYPYEWIAIRIDSEDQSTGEVSGEIIAHDPLQGAALRAASDYHEQHPGFVIDFFTTDLLRKRVF